MSPLLDPRTPQPPTDIPQVSSQTPDFRSVGEQISAGAVAAGFFQVIWKGFAAAMGEATGAVLAVFLNAFAWAGRKAVRELGKAENRSDAAFGELAATAINDVLGVNVSIGDVSARGNPNGTKAAAKNIGDAVLQGLFTGLGSAGADPTKPNSTAAEAYLTQVTNMALQNWLEGWMVEALSLGQLERFGDLGDAMARSWGLGRVTNRIVGPIAEIMIGDPFKAKINATYRPHLLSPAEACRQFTRGRWSRERLDEELSVQGYSAERQEALINAQKKFLDVGELDHLVARGLWSREQAVQHLRNQGYTEEFANAQLAIAENRRLDTYRSQWVNEALARYVARDIDSATWETVLDNSGLPERDRDMLRIVGNIRRQLRTKKLTTSEVEQAVKRQILTMADYRAHLVEEGYSDEDTQTLELLLSSEVLDARAAKSARDKREAERVEAARIRTEKAEKRRKEIEEQLALGKTSLSKFEAAVRAGVRSIEEYRSFLRARGYSAEDVATLAGLLAAGIEQKAADTMRREELRRQAAIQRISLGDAETAVKRGLTTIDEYRAFLDREQFAAADRELMVRLLEAELIDAAAAALRRDGAKSQLAERDVSLDDVERAVRRGLRTIDDYEAFLLELGFDAEEAGLLRALLESELDEDAAARERKVEAARIAAVRNVSLADLEKAVRAGLATIADYRGALARAGFTVDDLDLLARLLQLDIDSDAADAKARQEARDRAAARRISIDDLERAVKLGVVPIAVYQDGLKRAGLPADDQQILTLSLAAELAAAKSAQDAKARAAPAVKARGLSIAQFERSVREGLRTAGDYNGFLVGQGFSPVDASTLTALLQLDVEQAAAAARRRAEIEAELAVKQLSLAQFERAVKGDVRRIDEYAAFIRSQGYSELDVGTLITLLRQAVEAAAEV